jgi:hypothetical protein
LLHAATLLSPAEPVFIVKDTDFLMHGCPGIVLPCFHRVTSIDLDVGLIRISPPPAGEFPALENLSVAGVILDLGTLLSRCPRLRVLGVTFRGVHAPRWVHAALATLETAFAVLDLTMSLLGVDTMWINDGFEPLLRPWRGYHRGSLYSIRIPVKDLADSDRS